MIYLQINDLSTMSKMQKQQDPARVPSDAVCPEAAVPIPLVV